MISLKLQQHFIQKKLHKFSKERLMKRDANLSKKIYSVGILTEETFFERFDLQNSVVTHLELKNPKIYSFRKFQKHHEKSYKHFSEKDFDWKGGILDPGLQSFLDQPFDLLLCYFHSSNTWLQYAATLSEASFKVGFSNVNSDLYDLEIAVDSDQYQTFLAEVRKYLKILGKL